MMSHAQQTENRVALVIGNSAYKTSPLKNPINDAADMAARLKGFGFTVIERNNLTTKQIGSTLREFRSKLTPGSVALVFYAGHGVTIKGKNYLPAVDAEINGEEDVPNQSLGTEQIMDVLAEAKTRLNLVFLDACRDNPYARSFRSTTRGLSRESAPSGTMISFATKPGSVAADGTGRNGLYTSVLLEQLKSSNQPIEQVLKKVVSGVRVASKNQQEPWMEGSIEGDFCFGSCGQTSVSQVPAELSESQKEEIFWSDTKATGNSKAFEAYIKQYPNGRYADLARANIDKSKFNSVQEVVKIGHVAPLSGVIAHLGQDNENGARLAIEELNAKGVSINGKKVKFELLAEDDAADPKQGTAAAQKLVDSKVNGVVGHLNSGTSIPASKIYSDAGIPQISPSSTNPKFTRQGYITTFRLVADDAHLGSMLGRYAVIDLKGKNIAVIDDRTAYGRGVANEFEKAAKAAGATIVGREFTNDKATDFTAILTTLKGKNTDVVFFGGMDTVAGPMLKQMKSLGLNAKFIGGDGICTGEIIKLAGVAIGESQVFCAEAGGIDEKSVAAFYAKFKKRFNADVQIYAPYVYDAVNLLVESMVKANSTDPAVYLPVLAKTTGYKGVTGDISFDEKGDLKNGALTFFTYKGGRREMIKIVR